VTLEKSRETKEISSGDLQ